MSATGLRYQVFNPKPDNPRIIPYADNFSFKRTEPWTHWQMYVEAANGYLQDRLLFGTAYPALPLKATVDRFLALPFHDAVRPKLLFENAQRLFGGGMP